MGKLMVEPKKTEMCVLQWQSMWKSCTIENLEAYVLNELDGLRKRLEDRMLAMCTGCNYLNLARQYKKDRNSGGNWLISKQNCKKTKSRNLQCGKVNYKSDV